MSAIITLLLAMYIFFIQTSILYRMSYDSRLEKNVNLEISSRELEMKYYKLSQNISLIVASKLGFVNVKHTIYLEKDNTLSMALYGGTVHRE